MAYRKKYKRGYRKSYGMPNPLGFVVFVGFFLYSWFSGLSSTVKCLIYVGFTVLIIVFVAKCLTKDSLIENDKKENTYIARNVKRSVDNYEERSLLTETEGKFYNYLSNALQEYDVVVNVKTRLEDLAKVSAHKRGEYMRARGYIKSRHIDFILCDKDMNVVCGIELDDSSHQDPKAQEIDRFKDNLFNKINKELFRVNDLNKLDESAKYIVNTLYNENKIKKTETNEQTPIVTMLKEEDSLCTKTTKEIFLEYLTTELVQKT